MRAYGMALCPSGVNFFLYTTSSQEPLGQFQPNLAGNMLGDGPFCNKGQHKENFDKSSKIFFS